MVWLIPFRIEKKMTKKAVSVISLFKNWWKLFNCLRTQLLPLVVSWTKIYVLVWCKAKRWWRKGKQWTIEPQNKESTNIRKDGGFSLHLQRLLLHPQKFQNFNNILFTFYCWTVKKVKKDSLLLTHGCHKYVLQFLFNKSYL